jgi:hypothetical protein
MTDIITDLKPFLSKRMACGKIARVFWVKLSGEIFLMD